MTSAIIDKPAKLGTADHVFAVALTCLVLPVVRRPEEERMVTGIAVDVLPKITTADRKMQALSLAFAGYRGANAGAARATAEMQLRDALHDFNRWRLGEGQAALAAG